jgi:ribosomal-protein-alanine N-acetyltransferase
VEDDAAALYELRAWMNADDLPALRARLRGWESRVSPDGRERWLNWLIVGRDGGEPQGWVQATVRERSAKVAYAVLPQRRGTGVAAETVQAVTAWLHEHAGAAVVEADIDPENLASQAVARRAGFVRTDRSHDGDAVWEHVA